MQFNCGMCKADKAGRKYVYANSARTVKFYVCADCHKAKVQEMQIASSQFGADFVLGVLKELPKEE